MNLSEARIVLRPRGRLESLDLAFRYVLGDARGTFGRLAALTLVPAFVGVALCHRFLGFGWIAVWALALSIGPVLSGVFTVASGRLLFERALPVREVLSAYARRLPALLGALFLSRAALLAGSLVIVAGLLAWIRFSFVTEAVLLEQVPARRALSRSSFLSRAGADDALGTVAASLAMSVLIVFGFELLCSALVQDVLSIPFEGGSLLEEGGSYYALAGYFATLPWAAASRFLSYIDGRTRQDGWDVQVRLMALGAEGA